MSNPMKGEAKLLVGDTEHKLVINWDVLIKVERDCGLPLLLPNLWQHLGFLTALIRFALVAGGGKMIDNEQAARLMAQADNALPILHSTYLSIMPQIEAEEDAPGNG